MAFLHARELQQQLFKPRQILRIQIGAVNVSPFAKEQLHGGVDFVVRLALQRLPRGGNILVEPRFGEFKRLLLLTAQHEI
jgi:hypothetical protein